MVVEEDSVVVVDGGTNQEILFIFFSATCSADRASAAHKTLNYGTIM